MTCPSCQSPEWWFLTWHASGAAVIECNQCHYRWLELLKETT